MRNKKKLVFLLPILMAVYSNQCLGSESPVLEMLDKDVLNRITLLANSVSKCNDIAKSSELELNLNKFRTLNVSKETFLKSLFYLRMRNRDLCDSQERGNLIFAIGQLDFTRAELGLKVSKYGNSSGQLLYEPKKFLQYKIDYMNLTEDVRFEFERQVGTQPFVYTTILQNLNLNIFDK